MYDNQRNDVKSKTSKSRSNSNHSHESNRVGKRNEGSYAQNKKSKRNSSTKSSDGVQQSLDASKYVGRDNDPQWYLNNKRLILDASKFSFANQLGRRIQLNKPVVSGVDADATMAPFTVPGLMVLDSVPVPGVAQSAYDGVNIAAQLVFQRVRAELSTVASYAPADIMMYILGIDNIYSLYAHIVRMFGIMNAYSATNLYMPKALINGLYGPAVYDDLRSNYNNLRAKFNNIIYKASTLYMPVSFSTISRHAWLYSNYFMDANVLKGQMYAYRPAIIYRLNETDSDQGTKLDAVFMDMSSETTASYYIDLFDEMVELYRNSDSMLKIQADMRRAYSDKSVWNLAYVDENYVLLPTVSEEALTQIHNTTILAPLTFDDKVEGTSWDITQNVDKNTIVFHPYWYYITPADSRTLQSYQYLTAGLCTKILDFPRQEVSPEDVVVGTRNMAVCSVNNTLHRIYLDSCGADIVLQATVYNAAWEYPGPLYNTGWSPTVFYGGNFNSYTKWTVWSAFDWAPTIFINPSGSSAQWYPVTEFGNYTLIENDELKRLHDNVICSMWDVPEFGSAK